MQKFLLATAALFGVSTAASAMEFNYGVQVGYSSGSSDVEIPAYLDPTVDVDSDGWSAGAFAGFDWNVGPGWTLGVEGDANWTNSEGDALSGGGGGETFEIEQNWTASLRARAAFDISPSMEIYGALGVAWADMDAGYGPGASTSDSATLQGWTGGVGLEHDFGGWFGRVEYRYTAYDEEDFSALFASSDLTTSAILLSAGWTM